VPDDEYDDVARDRSYVEAFRAAGSTRRRSIEEFAEDVRARGSAVAIASAFDEWIDVREEACLFAAAERLRTISRILDPDPNRSRSDAGSRAAPTRTSTACSARGPLRSRAGDGPCDRSRDHPALFEQGQRLLPHRPRAHPTDPTIAVELARLLFYAGSQAEGENVYRIALSLRPEDATAHRELAWELDHLGIDHAAAVELARRATELAPNDFVSHFCLGHALRLLGDLDGAVAAQTAAAPRAGR
jgi:tetratricopeptide (TPR) repeat protein